MVRLRLMRSVQPRGGQTGVVPDVLDVPDLRDMMLHHQRSEQPSSKLKHRAYAGLARSDIRCGEKVLNPSHP